MAIVRAFHSINFIFTEENYHSGKLHYKLQCRRRRRRGRRRRRRGKQERILLRILRNNSGTQEVEGASSSCPIVAFDISGEPLASATI
jgi:hypothetical protein